MNKLSIQQHLSDFDTIATYVVGDLDNEKVEVWFARDLQPLLGYARWENFQSAIGRAIESCKSQEINVDDHFREVTKTISMPKGAHKDIQDFMLTRYACYLIAMNGDPKKEEIAFAQNYFAVQTRRAELVQQRILESERVVARQKLFAA